MDHVLERAVGHSGFYLSGRYNGPYGLSNIPNLEEVIAFVRPFLRDTGWTRSSHARVRVLKYDGKFHLGEYGGCPGYWSDNGHTWPADEEAVSNA